MTNNWLDDLGQYFTKQGYKNVFVGFKNDNPKATINEYILIMPESGALDFRSPFRKERFWVIVSHPNKKTSWERSNQIKIDLHNKFGKLLEEEQEETNKNFYNVFQLIQCEISPQALGTDSRGILEYHTKYSICFNDRNLNNNLH